ncbi:MAG TPA: alpha-1,4-glucan--maltose-1-phosphate maltosyltransferase [Thermomicrobiales bacterium]|nr:alpha-1,4-glucan--maltose-1-phosphate maltosyltransferase [Thermomicrobiales bacterium]
MAQPTFLTASRTYSLEQASHDRIRIEHVEPEIEDGRYPIKREVGDTITVSADIFRDGHEKIVADLFFKPSYRPTWSSVSMTFVDNDRWSGSFTVDENTRYDYTIGAIQDDFRTWSEEITKKLTAGLDVHLEIAEGLHQLQQADTADQSVIEAIRNIWNVAAAAESQSAAVELLTSPKLAALMRAALPESRRVWYGATLPVTVDRVRARYAAWYELFPRSAGRAHGQSGTFDDVIDRLDYIQELGFDTLYFPPIHPIGHTNRKGPNNTLNAGPADPGVPYAIGSEAGGHDAIEPALGTLEDFRRLVEVARGRGIELVLDFAINASPDHPWVEEHRDWFYIRPDGTIKFAENPPKRYEDVYPLNFSNPDWEGLWQEMRRIILFWIDQGVTAFRVDNPHTKPTAFWEWLIAEVQAIHPETIFLSEAFTRPKLMKWLAKAGFTQSYTYFTWRNFKQEIIDYFTELTTPPVSEYMRGNLFTNTPDILPYFLQESGRPGFKIRAVLAATLSSVYGIYSGFELCEATPTPGKEEYLNSEKYDFKVWDWDRTGNIRADIARLNQIRKEHPALQEYDNLRFYWSDSDSILVYGKQTADQSDNILVAVNLDPFQVHETTIHFPLDDFGMPHGEQYEAQDLISGERYFWSGGSQYVRLDPAKESAHIIHLRRWEHVAYVEPDA